MAKLMVAVNSLHRVDDYSIKKRKTTARRKNVYYLQSMSNGNAVHVIMHCPSTRAIRDTLVGHLYRTGNGASEMLVLDSVSVYKILVGWCSDDTVDSQKIE